MSKNKLRFFKSLNHYDLKVGSSRLLAGFPGLISFSLVSSILLAGCSGGGGTDFGSLSQVNNGPASCAVTTTNPSNTQPLRVSGVAGATTPISVGLSNSNCDVKFSLNGTEIATTGTQLDLQSDLLTAGTNTLTVSSGTTTKTWAVIKNRPPVCGVQTPATSGTAMGAGNNVTLSGTGSDPDADAITFGWTLNGSEVASSVLNYVSSSASSQAVFTPTSGSLGTATVSMVISDGVDKTNCDWNISINGSCQISSTNPVSTSTVRVSAASTATASFQANATIGCVHSWKLNGNTISGQNGASLALDPSNLIPGNNLLEVTVANGSSSDSKQWTVVRNIAPTCSSQNPGATGNSIGVGGNITLSGTGADSNGDPLTFNWTNNGVPAGSQFNITSSSNATSAVFTPDASASGTNNIRAVISDGLDSASCGWTVQTVPVCQIVSASPGVNTLRISANPNASQTFVATPNDSSCALTWELNGSAITGSQVLTLLSSQLTGGGASNTLVAKAGNGYSQTTKTWTITKNQAPTCASQSPGISGNNVGAGGAITFQGTAGNPDADTLTYSWSYNGVPTSPTYFSSTSSGNIAQTIFSPSNAQIGNNQSVTLSIADDYDSTTCNWNVNVLNACTIASTAPGTPGPVKVPQLSTATTSFTASANAGCNFSWSLNGSPISGATANSYILPSSSLGAGNNVLQVSVTNGLSTDSKSWTVVKNTPATCSSQNPAASGASVGAGGSLTFQLQAGNTDNDNLTYSWLYNGAAPNATYFVPSAFGNSASMAFSPNASFVGNNQSLSVKINDGYDDTTCNWSVNVLNSCTIASVAPLNGTPTRVAAAAGTTQTFQANANAGCNYTWTLNGSSIPSATSGSYSLGTADLVPGNNTLVVSVTNGTSTDSKTWNVVKNTAPVCSSQNPAATGNNIAVGGAVTLVGNATDANSDALTFNWKNNGSAVGSQFAVTSSAGSSQAVFTPDATNVGANSVQAVISDGYDSVNCAWNVQVAPSCSFASASPAASSAKVAFLGSTTTNFVASPSDASCTITWELNGSALSGATNPFLALQSSQLSAAPATNTLVAKATNGYSNATRTWTITKNQPPICSGQTPNSTGNAVAAGGSLGFTANAGNPDSDVLTYSWLYNGSAVSSPLFATSSSGNNASATFNPLAANVGNNQTLVATINDGYDSATCSWNVNVLNACSLSSLAPSATALKVAAAGSTNTAFSANATTGCGYTWTLNGSAISGATAGSYTLPSSSLNTGSNTLQVSISNGVSSDSRSWTVTKNTPSTCSTQNPGATGNTVGVGGSIALQMNATNTDGDSLTYGWTYNGSAATGAAFNTTSFGNSAGITFTPDSSYIGNGQTVQVAINDGYDTNTCQWAVDVKNSCTISTMTPSSGSSVRVAAATGTTNQFQASANPGCNFSWKLNGSTISGATAGTYSLASSDLSPGNNTLVVSVTNGTSTDTKQWTVVRNTPPLCSTQTPNPTGNTTAVGVTSNYTANGTDANSDVLTFAWKLNGAAAGSQFAVTPGANTSTAAFTPDGTAVGNNNLTATISDGYDSVNCAWTTQVLPACLLGSATPVSSTPKVAFASSTDNSFFAGPNDSSCTMSWSLNGSSLGITSPVAHVTSSQFSAAPSTSTLVATASNGYTTATKTWTVSKNQIPTCSAQTPAATGGSVGVGGNISFNATAGNPDNDTLTYAWTYNGSAANPSQFSTSSSGNTATAVFTPIASYVGSGQSVAVNINDGLDSAQCSWTVSVANACVISAVSPTTASQVRMAANGSYQTTYTANANTGCNYAWTLNGSTLSGQTGSTLNLASSQLSGGNNTLQVTASNGTSTDSKSWNVLKNSAPICSTQSPNSTGTVVAVGATQNFTANAVDANSDALTFTWTNNGSATGSQFVVTPGTNASTAAMTPDSAMVGSNALVATISDGLDSAQCSWTSTVKAPCAISAGSPSAATVKMAATSSATQDFIASTNDSSCALSWKLNGSTLSGATSALYTLTSSQLSAAPATNTLVATATDGFTTATKTWTVSKNQPPTCSSQAPLASGNAVSVGGNKSFTATAGNPDSDALTYSWIYNGAPVNASYFSTSSSGNTAQAVFTPPSAYVGNGQALSVNISDSYDSASCAWSVNVVNTCAITSAFPSTSTYKVANLASTSTSFGGIPSDSACATTWTLNGTQISTDPIVSIASSSLTNGPATNSLVLTLNNGVSTPTTRTWTVTKNRVPTCDYRDPATAIGSMVYSTTKNFRGAGADADSDTLSGFTWMFNGSSSSSSLFTSTSSSGASSQTTFVPTFSQVGTGQTVAVQFTDGYDNANCSWSFDITNPNIVQVTSCTPTGNPIVVYSTGVNSTQTLQVVASNATSNGYKWTQNGTVISGATASSYAITNASLTPGTYAFRGIASDAQGNTDKCDYSVKINAAPQITASSPNNSQTYRMNYGSTLSFNATASDGNNDALSYTWTLDGASNAALGSGTATVVLNPNYQPSLIGSHVVAVKVSDGYESATLSWNVEINLFTQQCNTLFNSSVGTAGGQICTLVGVPGMGTGLIPSADQTLIRTTPIHILDDGDGNWIFTDQLSHTVNFFNRSAAPITRWGITIPAGALSVVMGNGAAGITIDGLYNRQFKLDTPVGVAYDAATKYLYVADYTNNRVALMDNSGLVSTVFGSSSTNLGNNTTYNTDGQVGTQQACQQPAGLDLVNYGGQRWLYIACSGYHSIKRMDALPSSPTYQKGYIVVGRLSGGAVASGNADGVYGGSGVATTNQPWAIADDGNGNIYWTESNNTRVRMAATSGNALSLFQGAALVGQNMTIGLSDTAGTLTGLTTTFHPQSNSSTATKLQVTGPTYVGNGVCSLYRVQTLNASNTMSRVASSTAVTLTTTGTANFFTDAACTNSAGGVVTIPASAAVQTFYYKGTVNGANTVTAAAAGYTSDSQVTNVTAIGGTATKLAITMPPNGIFQNCTPITLQMMNASNQVAPYTSARTLLLNTNGIGNFYSNASCSTLSSTVTFAVGEYEKTMYYMSTVNALGGQTSPVLGYVGQNTTSVTSTPSAAGAAYFRYPRGLAVQTSGGAVQGLFVTNWDFHRVVYANSSASSVTIGGTAIGPGQIGAVFGTGTSGFNTDGLGNTTRVNAAYGVSISTDQKTLLVSDMNNSRVRTLDLLSANGVVSTDIGAGRVRSGNLGDSPTPASGMYLNAPTALAFDSSNRKMYVADSINSRIRRVDMLTGWVDTIIGKGTGAGSVEGEDPTNAFLQYPHGLALTSVGGTNLLVYSDQAASGTPGGGAQANANCQIRALNLTPNINNPPAVNYLGASIGAYKINTLVGDYGAGCQTNTGAIANTDLGQSSSTKLYYTEGIASDGTNLYSAQYSDHCILKHNPSGSTSVMLGNCGVAPNPTTDGQSNVATTRFPTAITMDPVYAADGNFFFADSIDLNPTKIRYVNFRTTSVTIGNFTVPAAQPPYAQVTTLWTIALSGGGRVFGLAAFDKQLCIAGGWPTGGSTGPHNVTCYDRLSSLAPVTLRVGPNEASSPAFKAGAPLSNIEQEGIASTSAFLNGPYGIVFDSSGNLYISERNNHMIRMVRRWW